ncbi:uncharacterized protein LOC129959267 [Argiope bruennichi]|uniref:uncharacterized protein LOC129959261 n=1 Tax=Argiope bruennichi TaxID=94029 RepID=UPI002494469C|nr:uncharacterized protein LOC129959261 [Argiope bruennichi]XP_055928060.1 uncharacterized protein LOC129959263 [Argiope bruennichi]XP_055928063.1 uncharacterized protein LOC129959265 [Argiope bruennichi]XP_055928065.1 uncharacterized protein LOC129959267 [Argiope bruennichi]
MAPKKRKSDSSRNQSKNVKRTRKFKEKSSEVKTSGGPKSRKIKEENLDEVQKVTSSERNVTSLPEGNNPGPSQQGISSERDDIPGSSKEPNLKIQKTTEKPISKRKRSNPSTRGDESTDVPALSEGNITSLPEGNNPGPSQQGISSEHDDIPDVSVPEEEKEDDE